jgi:hypothetical protein
MILNEGTDSGTINRSQSTDPFSLLYARLRASGVIQSQYEFSRLCGRQPTWYSSLKARGSTPSFFALYILAYNLRGKAARGPASLDCAFVCLEVEKMLNQIVAARRSKRTPSCPLQGRKARVMC